MGGALRAGLAREAGVLTAVVLVILALALAEPRFLRGSTASILALILPLTVVGAMGQLPVIVARHVDISMGSVLALAAMTAGLAFRDLPGLPVAGGFLIGIAVGAAAGLVNALLIARLGLHSIIVTLATLSVYRGMVFMISGGDQVSAQELPEALFALAQPGVLGLPGIALMALAVVLATHLLLRHTGLGRQLFAAGSNPDAARLRGVRVEAATMAAFVLSGACAGLAGVMYAARFGIVNPSSVGAGFELTVIAAVIVGGASIAGGGGTVTGAVLGVLLLAIVDVALPLLGVPRVWQGVLAGGIILAALAVDAGLRRLGSIRA